MHSNVIDKYWMKKAIILAKTVQEKEVPVGAILVLKNRIIGEGWNCSIGRNDPTAHAEIIAMRRGGKKIKNYRLLNTSIYVTMEPCMMCIGAMIHARISRLIFGTEQKKNLEEKEIINLCLNSINMKNKISITKGVLSKYCSKQIKSFFLKRRYSKNKILTKIK